MDAQTLKLDYYNFYDVANQDAGYIVGLQGQFDKQPEKARLNYLNLFANPASKNGQPIYDKNAHFTWYDVYDPMPDPTRVVAYENQFGQGKMYIGRNYALLAPAQKVEAGSAFPKELDHYRVYQVLDPGEPSGQAVKVEDQWGGQELRLYYPYFFAVPVRKWWEGQAFGIHNEKTHMVIYRSSPFATEKVAPVIDQFSRRYVQAFRGVLFGVPSVKLEWQEA